MLKTTSFCESMTFLTGKFISLKRIYIFICSLELLHEILLAPKIEIWALRAKISKYFPFPLINMIYCCHIKNQIKLAETKTFKTQVKTA